MKKFPLFLICLFSLTMIAQKANVEVIPITQPVPAPNNQTDSLNLHFSFPCIAFEGEFGIESDEDYIYVTQCNGDSIAKYDEAGNLLESFLIPGVSNIRDLAYDGDLYFGGADDNYLYVIDIVDRNLITKQEIPFVIQGIAYDEWDDTFWISQEGSPVLYYIDHLGTNLGNLLIEGFDSINITGLAISEDHYHDYFLWVFCQNGSQPLLLKYNLDSYERLGYEIDLSALVSGDAQSGGLYFEGNIFNNYGYIVGVIQDQLVFALDIDYANQLVNTGENTMLKKFDIYPNPVTDVLNVNLEPDIQDEITCTVVNTYGHVVYSEQISANSVSNILIDTKEMQSGTYILKLTSNKGYSVAKTFLKIE